MATIKPKSKLAYLKYEQIQPYIDSGKLDQYDYIFITDRKTWAIIDKELNIVEITARLDSYQSESDAITALNNKSDTYIGQIVNILENDEFIPYSVNRNSSTNRYYITPIGTRDYDKLENKPIINIVSNTETIISELDDGIYSLVGNYRISELDTTHRMTGSKIFLIKETSTDTVGEETIQRIHITEINGKSIQKYICTTDAFVEDRYVMLSEMGDEVSGVLDVELPGRLDEYVANNQASDQDIRNLFP